MKNVIWTLIIVLIPASITFLDAETKLSTVSTVTASSPAAVQQQSASAKEKEARIAFEKRFTEEIDGLGEDIDVLHKALVDFRNIVQNDIKVPLDELTTNYIVLYDNVQVINIKVDTVKKDIAEFKQSTNIMIDVLKTKIQRLEDVVLELSKYDRQFDMRLIKAESLIPAGTDYQKGETVILVQQQEQIGELNEELKQVKNELENVTKSLLLTREQVEQQTSVNKTKMGTKKSIGNNAESPNNGFIEALMLSPWTSIIALSVSVFTLLVVIF